MLKISLENGILEARVLIDKIVEMKSLDEQIEAYVSGQNFDRALLLTEKALTLDTLDNKEYKHIHRKRREMLLNLVKQHEVSNRIERIRESFNKKVPEN